ncbi:DUF2460 domain-containing protein [Pseudomonas gingeri]|uniref:DUF2460 domain-containing protein n=1 Tax=Pseudomonas gingeri TaxID=117681 RepID=UPI0015A24451|nr:DUF2460 domain-containing protein [Pseudomonas gingeri]NWA25515.1 DUF2460 domain-containing protein [Pseudomonas gingeri]
MFNETRLLDCVSYGSQFGQEFNTRITTLKSGHERRNANWTRPLGRYSVSFGALKPGDHMAVRGAHMACLGSAIAFRFKDWTDFRAEQELIGVGTGVSHTYTLRKNYPFGPVSLQRPIAKPVVGTVKVYEAGQAIAAVVDYTTGIITVTAPPGSPITWSGEFDVPVRFEADRLDVDPVALINGDYVLSADVDLVEIRL